MDYNNSDRIILADCRQSLDLSKPKQMFEYQRLSKRLGENNSIPMQKTINSFLKN